MALATVCDITLASTNATFGLTEINVGVFGGVMHARRWFSETVVRDLALTGRFMPAAEALERGAIHSVVEPDQLMPAAWQLGEIIAEKNLPGIALGKAAANASENLTVSDWKTEFPTYTDLLFNHPEAKDAARAFFERRKGGAS
jgi:enoyl-CoA hydratase/carnithine racemase